MFLIKLLALPLIIAVTLIQWVAIFLTSFSAILFDLLAGIIFMITLAGLKKRLAAFSKKYPDLCQMEKPEHLGGVSYLIDKSRLSIRLQPPYSEERRQKASQYARRNGFSGKTK